MNNLTPNYKTLTRIPLFRRAVLQSFPFIEEDFDALTDYELLCKVVEYLNKVIEQQNLVGENTDELLRVYLQLKDYVDHYFDNLDVQDEIDNKLDRMVEDGTLQEIVSDYLNTKAVFGFDTLLDMKNATNLIDGSFAETYGYYSYGDGGSAKYKIREVTNQDTEDDMFIVALHDNNLVAELIVEKNSINTKQIGAIGDGTTNDTNRIQSALNFASDKKIEFIINDGTYMINASTGVLPKDDTTITFINAKLKAIPNNLEHSQVLKFDKVHNITINNCVIEGERNEHTGSTGEWGHCIYFIGSCENITFNNANLSNAWGDGIEMFAQNENNVWKYPKHIYFNGMTYIHNCGRQGVSIIAGEHIYFDTLYCKDINRVPPSAAIDIETEGLTWNVGNIHINYLKSEGTAKAYSFRNKGGITGDFSVGRIEHINPIVDQYNPSAGYYNSPITIFFDQYNSSYSNYNFNFGDIITDYGTFVIQNAYIGASPTVHIDNIFSKTVQMVRTGDVNRFRSLFYIYYDKQCNLTNKLGGITINNIIIQNALEKDNDSVNGKWYSVYYNFDDNNTKTFENCNINCKLINHDNSVSFGNNAYPTSNVIFNNVNIKVNNPSENIRSASNSDTTKIVGGLNEIYFTPTDTTGTDRRLILRPTNAFIGGKIYAKGDNTLKINLVYNNTDFTGVYENGNAITIDGSNNYVITPQTENTIYNITTDNKNIYVEVI